MLEIIQEILSIMDDIIEELDAAARHPMSRSANIAKRIKRVRQIVSNLEASELESSTTK